MNFKFNRLISLFLIIVFLLSFMPAAAFAQENSSKDLILSEDFELENSDLWLGGVRDNIAAFEGDWGFAVSNSYGDKNSNYFGHNLHYEDYIHLEKGKFYTFSAQIMNPFSEENHEPEASAYISDSSEELYIDITSATFEWSLVSASFMATEDTSYKLIISCDGGEEDLGFFIDNLTITEESKAPLYTVLDGPDTVFVPENGTSLYRYNIVAYNKDDTKVNILMDSFNFSVGPLPKGIEFDTDTGIMMVSNSAPYDYEIVISCNATAGIPLQSSEKVVTTTKNLLADPSFEEGMEMWVSDYDIDYIDGTIALFAEENGDYGKFTAIRYTEQLMLMKGKMYVFRADVRSEDGYSSSSVYISNLSFSSDGYAEINITGIGGEWNQVTSAFIVEDTGLYDLTINLYAPTERPIFIDNVYLGVEEEAATSISIRAPGNICVPQSVIVLPCYANVLNQMGQVMDSLSPTVTISPKEKGVYLENGEIIVENGAHRDDYTVTAQYGDITSTITITVSDDYVGDGGFEEKEANEWWTASDGSNFTIADYDGDLSGHVYSPDSSCIVVNNSYMELTEGEYYVFSASPGFGDATVTAFIADAYTGDYIPFAQYDNQEGVKTPFSVEATTVGRLVLYLEADDFIGVFLDDIAISPYELSASEITVTDGGYAGFLNGSYTYLNNMTDNADADISATRWYISPTYDGQYLPIGVPNQDYLEYTNDMVGQYVVYEVTPICSYTGLVGDPLRSLPFLIEHETIGTNSQEGQLSAMMPVELEETLNHSFKDITSHWGERMIATLSASGIVTGRTNTHFVPGGYVTRAEFTVMIARAFSLSSIPYTGQFEDVSSSDWYAGWIEAAYKRGIIQGITEKEFAPDDFITREQMATIIYRAYVLCDGPMPNDLELKYYDSFLISPWSYEAVKNCTNLNILTGTDQNVFNPTDRATRADAAAIIYRTLKCFY